MAKAKKSEASTDKKPAKAQTKSPAKQESKAKAETARPAARSETAKPAAKAEAPRKAAPKKSPAAPVIDTSLAAQAAATMLVNRDMIESAAEPKKEESSTFKNLKDQLARPKPASLSHLLGGGAAAKKAGPQFNMNQQKGHNQTFNAFNKTGVPRRTNG